MDALRLRSINTNSASRQWRKWLVVWMIGVALVTCCYFWVDRPLASWVYAHQAHFGVRDDFAPIARIPNPAVLASLVVFFVLGFRRLARAPFAHLEQVALFASVSVLLGETVKDVLKWVFGRPSPDVWVTSNVSALGFHEYQLHWFHGVEPFNSFPSGHMTSAAALIAILWTHYPQLRAGYVVCLGIVASVLVAFNFHFLSDVIAGGLLGSTIGVLVSCSFSALEGDVS